MAKTTPSPAPAQPAEPTDQDPPAGGRWIRQPDGSLTPHPDDIPPTQPAPQE